MRSAITDEIIVNFAKFTSADNLADWYECSKEYTPYFNRSSDQRSRPAVYKCIDSEKGHSLSLFYAQIGEDVCGLFENTFDVAIEHLFQSVKGDQTLVYLETIIKILEVNHIELPDVNQISFSTFDQVNGWGEDFRWENVWI